MSPLLILGRKILQLLHILLFSSIFCMFDPFQTVTVWFEFTLRTTEGLSYTTDTKGENTYWCYRGNLMHWKQEGVNFWTGWCVFFFILFKCLNCFHLVPHSRSYINTYMFPRRQNKYNLPWSSNSQGLPPPPPALNSLWCCLGCQYLTLGTLPLKYMFVCSAEERCSCRFGTTWGWINDGGIDIFGCTIPFKS